MGKTLDKITGLSYEQRLIVIATVTVCVSAVIAMGKIVIGILTDYVLLALGAFGVFLVLAKLQCILGVRSNKRSFEFRNTVISVLVFAAGVMYIIYMSLSLKFGLRHKQYNMFESVMLAFIAFVELGVAIFGLAKTKRRGHFYRDIKIINFISSLAALLTAQIAILSFMQNDADETNCYLGIVLGGVAALLSILIYFTPSISTVDREHNVFKLNWPDKNTAVDMTTSEYEITLVKSRIYGDQVYRAEISEDTVDGHIIKHSGILKRLNPLLKVLFIILSEILIFVWAAGYAVYFTRTIDLPGRLHKKMSELGFSLVSSDGCM